MTPGRRWAFRSFFVLGGDGSHRFPKFEIAPISVDALIALWIKHK
jgi:hypothetical protein